MSDVGYGNFEKDDGIEFDASPWSSVGSAVVPDHIFISGRCGGVEMDMVDIDMIEIYNFVGRFVGAWVATKKWSRQLRHISNH